MVGKILILIKWTVHCYHLWNTIRFRWVVVENTTQSPNDVYISWSHWRAPIANEMKFSSHVYLATWKETDFNRCPFLRWHAEWKRWYSEPFSCRAHNRKISSRCLVTIAHRMRCEYFCVYLFQCYAKGCSEWYIARYYYHWHLLPRGIQPHNKKNASSMPFVAIHISTVFFFFIKCI